MVRAFLPQGRNKNINANTNNPPQGIKVAGETPPPTGQVALVQTGTLTALVQTGTLTALVQTGGT
jgi:hypothetical protein